MEDALFQKTLFNVIFTAQRFSLGSQAGNDKYEEAWRPQMIECSKVAYTDIYDELGKIKKKLFRRKLLSEMLLRAGLWRRGIRRNQVCAPQYTRAGNLTSGYPDRVV